MKPSARWPAPGLATASRSTAVLAKRVAALLMLVAFALGASSNAEAHFTSTSYLSADNTAASDSPPAADRMPQADGSQLADRSEPTGRSQLADRSQPTGRSQLAGSSQPAPRSPPTDRSQAADRPSDIHLTWDVSTADLHWSLNLDADGNGAITWAEIESRRADIAAFAAEHLQVAQGGEACDTQFTDLLVTEHAGEPHLSLDFLAHCAKRGALSLSATVFFDTNTTQRTLLAVTTSAGEFTSILSPDSPKWTEPKAPSALTTFITFVGQGLWHVWIGYDHLAFLLLLLLPGVLRAVGATGWQAVPTFKETARDLLRIITAFTLAHSLTLALATTGTVHIPVRPVEVAIAASIVIAGLLNLFPRAARARLALAFGFGLVHGFGFANALAELGARGARLVPALAGFNIGVELAQLSLVLLVLPLLFRARNSAFYAWRFMPTASLVAAMAGAAWLVARTS